MNKRDLRIHVSNQKKVLIDEFKEGDWVSSVDITSKFLRGIIEFIPSGTSLTINSRDSNEEYKISVERILAVKPKTIFFDGKGKPIKKASNREKRDGDE